jgi:hypothetical protein
MTSLFLKLNVWDNFCVITISVRPESGPQILGLRPEYNVEETIDVMCTSARAYPAAQLDFFINDEPVCHRLHDLVCGRGKNGSRCVGESETQRKVAKILHGDAILLAIIKSQAGFRQRFDTCVNYSRLYG